MKYLLIFIGIASLSISVAQSQTLFEDGFEGDLSQWSVVGFGTITLDPNDTGNNALSFSSTADSGDMFSPPLTIDESATYTLTFRYLGTNLEGSGGYLWLSDPANPYSPETPVFGTSVENSSYLLVDNGQWGSYELTFTLGDLFSNPSGQLQIVIEDWNGAAGGSWAPPNVAGDAVFDDVKLERLGAIQTESVSLSSIKALF